MPRGQKTWGKNVGNRSNNRHGEINGKHYMLGGLQWYKYSLEINGKGIYSLKAIHELISKSMPLYKLEKGFKTWQKFNYDKAEFENVE